MAIFIMDMLQIDKQLIKHLTELLATLEQNVDSRNVVFVSQDRMCKSICVLIAYLLLYPVVIRLIKKRPICYSFQL